MGKELPGTRELREVLLAKYKHILNHEEDCSIEEMVEQIVNYYEDTIKCMPGNIYLFDKNLSPITCNQNVLDMLGYQSVAEFKEKTFEKMGEEAGWSKDAEQSFKKDTLEVIEKKKPKLHVEEPPIYNKNGEMIYFLSSRVPLFDHVGEISGIVGISTDITELKKMSISLQKALVAAEAASISKTEFIRNMSHDMRTPLAGIIGMSAILENETHAEDVREGLHDIREAGQSLLDLLNEIIETAKLESGEMSPQKTCFSLKNTIHALTAIFKPAIKDKGLKFETYYDDNIPDVLFGQELLLHRIVLNLLGNAVKFTDKGAISFEVSLAQKREKDVTLKIVVKDTGVGIPLDKQEVIFEKFSRLAPSYSNKNKGSGLGLYIVKEFIIKLGGEIKLISVPGKGSQFTCTVQFKIPTQAQMDKCKKELQNKKNLRASSVEAKEATVSALSSQSAIPVAGTKRRILLVEDTLLPRKVATSFLTTEGYDVVTAETAQEAVEKSRQMLFDLIYMDIGLPGASGLDVTKTIRSQADNPNINTPIIALTAQTDKTVREQCLASGMQEVFDKPLMKEHLKVAEALMKKQS